MDKKKLLAGLGIGLIGLTAGIGAGFVLDTPDTVVQTVTKTVYEDKIVEVIKEVPVEVIKTETVEIEVPVEVEIDNGNLKVVLDHIYDNEGQIEYLLDDLDDDEVDMIVERIVFINEAKMLAIAEVKSEGIDMLDKEYIEDIKLDEDDIDRFRIYDDDDEVIIDDVDFEDKDAQVLVEAKFEQDDIKYKALYEVTFKDGIVDDIDLEEITLRD